MAGGFIANLLLHRRSRRQEMCDLKRLKLEEIYEQSCAVEASVDQLVVFWATFGVTKAAAPSNEDGRVVLDKLKLMSLFYHPELRGEVRAFEEAVDAFHAAVSRYGDAVLEKRGQVPDLFNTTVNEPAEAVRAARRALMDEAAKLAPRYL